MDITINQVEDRLVVALIGDLDNAASSQAERSLAPVYDFTDGDILIDCTQLNYISGRYVGCVDDPTVPVVPSSDHPPHP